MVRDDDTVDAEDSPAHLTRTSNEVLGRRGLPRVLVSRAVAFILGPPGVGKTTVARRICGEERLELGSDALRRAFVAAARKGALAAELREAPALLLDDVDFLHNRFGPQQLLGRLLAERAQAGRRTLIVQGPADSSVTLLYTFVPLQHRASLLLRFPVGSGRRVHVRRRAAELGVPWVEAQPFVNLEPWTYAGVEEGLRGVLRQVGG